MTRRRSSYRSLTSLQRDLRGCRACVEAGYPLTLAERFQRVDPYLTTLERVRGRLLSLVDRALEEEPA